MSFTPAAERTLDEKIRVRNLVTIQPADGASAFDQLELMETAGARLVLGAPTPEGNLRRVGPMTTRAEAVDLASAIVGNGRSAVPDVIFKLALGVLALDADAKRAASFRGADLSSTEAAAREVL